MHNDPQKWHTDQVDTVRTFVAAVHVQMRDSHRPSAACPPEHDGSSVATPRNPHHHQRWPHSFSLQIRHRLESAMNGVEGIGEAHFGCA